MFDQPDVIYTSTQSTGGFTGWPFIIIGVIALVVVILFFRRATVYRKSLFFRSIDMVFFEIQVPRESSEDKFGQETTKQNEKELIGIAEQLYTTLSFPQESWWQRLWHGREIVSFEIAAFDKKIHFFIACPRKMASVVERQVHGQYPKASVEVAPGYQIFRKGNFIASAEIQLQKKYAFPIKTYEEQNSDPLNAITNTMSKLAADESMVLQMILTPAHSDWGAEPRRFAKEIQKGKNAHKVINGGIMGDILSMPGQDKKKEEDYKATNLTPMQQDMVKKLEEKASKIGYYINLRVVASSDSKEVAESHISSLMAAFTQYTLAPFNGFKAGAKNSKKTVRDFVLRNYNKKALILNTAELASVWHLPTKFTETPNIQWLTSRKAPAPINAPESGTLLGINSYRGVKTPIHILDEDRMRHTYVIGRTGVGKTELMKFMAAQDIKNGKGVCIVDPHGDLIEDMLAVIPKERAEDVILFDPSDMSRPLGLNMLDTKDEHQKDFVVQEMLAIFEKLFPPEVIGPMFEHNMRNVMLTLVANHRDPGTIVEIPRMFTDPAFQKQYVDRVDDPTVLSFWEQEMAKTSDFHKSEMLGYMVSKVGRFVENTMMRNIIGQKHSSFDFREVMDSGKILLVNLSKGKIGELNAKLLGLIIVSKLQMAALSRADIPESERREFYLYVDEFQNFVTDSFATILSEARKYKLGLTVAHQYLSQLAAEKPGSSASDTKVRDAVFGNVGTMVAFRIGVEDAEVIAREMAPTFNEFDVVNIERYNAYIKLMIQNTVSRPFSMQTLPLEKTNDKQAVEALRQLSRLKYGRLRQQVESEITDRAQLSKVSLEPKDELLPSAR